jgi:hypothetical protein
VYILRESKGKKSNGKEIKSFFFIWMLKLGTYIKEMKGRGNEGK